MKKWKFQPYKKRPIRFLKCETLSNWKVKIYGISATKEFDNVKLVDIAKRKANKVLPKNSKNSKRYGVGFMILHEAQDGNYILISWWEQQNMLCHKVFEASSQNPFAFTSMKKRDIIACIWELEVIYFEKIAWSKAVLQKPDNPNFDEYLSLQLIADI